MSVERKIYIKFMGGLGNQMFQYAAAQVLKQFYGGEIYAYTGMLADPMFHIPRKYDLDIFQNINLRFTTSIPNAALRISSYSEFDARVANKNPIVLEGFFQDVRAFLYQDIKKDFYLGEYTHKKAKNLASQIKQDDLCLNIRRADYADGSDTSHHHGFLGQQYVNAAIKNFTSIDKLYIFSDEPDWCAANIKTPFPTVVVDHSYSGQKFSDYLRLMTQFDNIIIPNSTFAWWAAIFALLRNHNARVVCPDECLWYTNSPGLATSLLKIDDQSFRNFKKIKRGELV